MTAASIAIARGSSYGSPSRQYRSPRPCTPTPIGLRATFEVSDSGVGYELTSITRFRLRVTCFAASCNRWWSTSSRGGPPLGPPSSVASEGGVRGGSPPLTKRLTAIDARLQTA